MDLFLVNMNGDIAVKSNITATMTLCEVSGCCVTVWFNMHFQENQAERRMKAT